MPSSIKILTVRGIPVDINVTWLIAFAIITWSLATSAFPSFFQFWSTQDYWLAAVVTTIFLFTSVLAHELGHSFVALSQGLKVRGITLLLFGGVSRIEGDASRPRNEFFIAFAGPAVSLLIGLLLLGWWFRFGPVTESQVTPLHGVLFFTGWMNILVGGFNLLPGYPLDGGRVLRSIVWGLTDDTRFASRVTSIVGRVVFYLLIGWGGWRILNGDVFGGIWIAFIGWFLLTSARGEQRARQASESVSENRPDSLGFRVALAARDMPVMVDEHTSVSRALANGYEVDRQVSIPVAKQGALVGFVTVDELEDVPEPQRSEIEIGQVMNPESLRVIDAHETARVGLQMMDRFRVSQLVVMEAGIVAGVVTRLQILRRMTEFMASRDVSETRDDASL